MDKWAELRTAYQVARLGTASAAADALGFHRATVNRHIDLLEAELGGRLLIRHARGYALTALGEDVLRVAQKTEELIDDLAGRANGAKTGISGEMKLTILPPFAGLLMGAIASFRAQNPNCLVHIDTSEDLARLEYGEAHIALRAGAKPDHPDHVASFFGRFGFNLYAHDSHIRRSGLPEGPGDMDRHQFVVSNIQGGRLPFRSWINDNARPDMIALSARNIEVNIAAMSAGIGMGFIADHEAEARGGFHPVLPANRDWTAPLWLVTHVDLHRTEKVRAMPGCLKSARASK